jgi:hypothetical protein
MAAPGSIRAGSDAPGPVPQTGNAELEAYIGKELQAIWTKQQMGQCQMLQLEPLNQFPPRVADGMICFFIAGVAGPQAGLYEFKGGVWSKL